MTGRQWLASWLTLALAVALLYDGSGGPQGWPWSDRILNGLLTAALLLVLAGALHLLWRWAL